MEWSNENHPSGEEGSQPKIKPRRIDAPHPAVPGTEAHALEISSRVTADAPLGGSGGDDSPDFHEGTQLEPAAWERSAAGDDAPTSARPLPDAESQGAAGDVSLEAEQLAAVLQEQLRELDQREASLHDRAAELENQWRACQTSYQQHLAQLNEREAELSRRQAEMEVFTQREDEVAERLRDCEAQELAVDQREANLNDREATLVAREHDLRDRRQEVEREAAALSRSQQLWEQSKGREEQALERQRRQTQANLDGQLSQRVEELEEAKARLAEHARALEQDRQSFHREREAWQHQTQQAGQRNAQQQQRTEEEMERRRSALTARESALDTQQAALELLRGEMTSAYRQALEMRLIAEQLWAQLKGLLTPAEITQSLAQLRLKMAEQYELEEKALAERKEELLALADKLAQQHATLKAQRMEFLAWRKAQQEEIAHQAEHLCRRMQELSEEHRQLQRAA